MKSAAYFCFVAAVAALFWVLHLLPDSGTSSNTSSYALGPADTDPLIVPLTLAITQDSVPNVTYQGPLTITQGGTYTGNYRSTDSGTPAVTIATSAPVTLQGCVLVGPGDLIQANGAPADLTVLNSRAYGTTPTQDNRYRGRFVAASNARNIRAENNYLEHTTGFTIYQFSGDGSANQTVRILRNQVLDVDGRTRNGGTQIANFVGLNTVRNLANLEIAWNQVVNEPNLSSVEDNINLYNSGGTAQSPARIHDNYVQGAYPFPATAASFSGTGMTTDGDSIATFSGTGMTTDGNGTTASTVSAFVNAYNNQFVSTCNAAMNIAAGHDIHYYYNRIVTSALLPDGTPLNAVYAGAAIFNGNHAPSSIFFNNTIHDNTIGYRNPSYSIPYPERHDLSKGACSTCTNTTHLPNPITLQTEAKEFTLWQQKLAQNGIVVGPAGFGTPTSAAPTVRLGTGLSLYSNPVNAGTQLHLPVAHAEAVEFGIYSVQGKLLSRQRVRVEPNAPNVPVPTRGLSAGAYVLRVLSGSHQGQSIRFAKE